MELYHPAKRMINFVTIPYVLGAKPEVSGEESETEL